MKIAFWNVNSIRARLTQVSTWLGAHQPDVLCLQETKVEDAHFPREAIEDQGYNVEAYGEKNWNGVAIAARWPIEDVVRGLPGADEKRLLACRVRGVDIVDVYVPNGQAIGSEKYTYKLDWFGRLRAFVAERLTLPGAKLVVGGDFNVTFDDRDVWDPEGMREQIHCSTAERAALRALLDLGLHDSLRRFHEEPGLYTWWDYRGAGLARNQGLRIDHLLMSDAALATCVGVAVDVEARRARDASDHAPVVATFAEPSP